MRDAEQGRDQEGDPYRLPVDAGERVALAREVVARIMAGSGAPLGGGAEVRIERFDPSKIEAAKDMGREELRKAGGALFWVALQGIDANQLLSVHAQDSDPGEQPTALRLGVSDFLNRAPGHIVGVVFSSSSGLFPTVDGSTDSGGITNFFLKEESPLWHASFRGPLRAAGLTQ